EILSHGADVLNRGILAAVTPTMNGNSQQPVEDFTAVDRCEVDLGVPVAQRLPRAAPFGKSYPRDGVAGFVEPGDEANAPGRAHRELVRCGGVEIKVGGIG